MASKFTPFDKNGIKINPNYLQEWRRENRQNIIDSVGDKDATKELNDIVSRARNEEIRLRYERQ
tara:strand:+ start:373 stop:564 length:192 start_codon:yes stop_codon:yes gene_type:complete